MPNPTLPADSADGDEGSTGNLIPIYHPVISSAAAPEDINGSTGVLLPVFSQLHSLVIRTKRLQVFCYVLAEVSSASKLLEDYTRAALNFSHRLMVAWRAVCTAAVARRQYEIEMKLSRAHRGVNQQRTRLPSQHTGFGSRVPGNEGVGLSPSAVIRESDHCPFPTGPQVQCWSLLDKADAPVPDEDRREQQLGCHCFCSGPHTRKGRRRHVYAKSSRRSLAVYKEQVDLVGKHVESLRQSLIAALYQQFLNMTVEDSFHDAVLYRWLKRRRRDQDAWTNNEGASNAHVEAAAEICTCVQERRGQDVGQDDDQLNPCGERDGRRSGCFPQPDITDVIADPACTATSRKGPKNRQQKGLQATSAGGLRWTRGVHLQQGDAHASVTSQRRLSARCMPLPCRGESSSSQFPTQPVGISYTPMMSANAARSAAVDMGVAAGDLSDASDTSSHMSSVAPAERHSDDIIRHTHLCDTGGDPHIGMSLPSYSGREPKTVDEPHACGPNPPKATPAPLPLRWFMHASIYLNPTACALSLMSRCYMYARHIRSLDDEAQTVDYNCGSSEFRRAGMVDESVSHSRGVPSTASPYANYSLPGGAGGNHPSFTGPLKEYEGYCYVIITNREVGACHHPQPCFGNQKFIVVLCTDDDVSQPNGTLPGRMTARGSTVSPFSCVHPLGPLSMPSRPPDVMAKAVSSGKRGTRRSKWFISACSYLRDGAVLRPVSGPFSRLPLRHPIMPRLGHWLGYPEERGGGRCAAGCAHLSKGEMPAIVYPCHELLMCSDCKAESDLPMPLLTGPPSCPSQPLSPVVCRTEKLPVMNGLPPNEADTCSPMYAGGPEKSENNFTTDPPDEVNAGPGFIIMYSQLCSVIWESSWGREELPKRNCLLPGPPTASLAHGVSQPPYAADALKIAYFEQTILLSPSRGQDGGSLPILSVLARPIHCNAHEHAESELFLATDKTRYYTRLTLHVTEPAGTGGSVKPTEGDMAFAGELFARLHFWCVRGQTREAYLPRPEGAGAVSTEKDETSTHASPFRRDTATPPWSWQHCKKKSPSGTVSLPLKLLFASVGRITMQLLEHEPGCLNAVDVDYIGQSLLFRALSESTEVVVCAVRESRAHEGSHSRLHTAATRRGDNEAALPECVTSSTTFLPYANKGKDVLGEEDTLSTLSNSERGSYAFGHYDNLGVMAEVIWCQGEAPASIGQNGVGDPVRIGFGEHSTASREPWSPLACDSSFTQRVNHLHYKPLTSREAQQQRNERLKSEFRLARSARLDALLVDHIQCKPIAAITLEKVPTAQYAQYLQCRSKTRIPSSSPSHEAVESSCYAVTSFSHYISHLTRYLRHEKVVMVDMDRTLVDNAIVTLPPGGRSTVTRRRLRSSSEEGGRFHLSDEPPNELARFLQLTEQQAEFLQHRHFEEVHTVSYPVSRDLSEGATDESVPHRTESIYVRPGMRQFLQRIAVQWGIPLILVTKSDRSRTAAIVSSVLDPQRMLFFNRRLQVVTAEQLMEAGHTMPTPLGNSPAAGTAQYRRSLADARKSARDVLQRFNPVTTMGEAKARKVGNQEGLCRPFRHSEHRTPGKARSVVILDDAPQVWVETDWPCTVAVPPYTLSRVDPDELFTDDGLMSALVLSCLYGSKCVICSCSVPDQWPHCVCCCPPTHWVDREGSTEQKVHAVAGDAVISRSAPSFMPCKRNRVVEEYHREAESTDRQCSKPTYDETTSTSCSEDTEEIEFSLQPSGGAGDHQVPPTPTFGTPTAAALPVCEASFTLSASAPEMQPACPWTRRPNLHASVDDATVPQDDMNQVRASDAIVEEADSMRFGSASSRRCIWDTDDVEDVEPQ